jgi:hypothetical protein
MPRAPPAWPAPRSPCTFRLRGLHLQWCHRSKEPWYRANQTLVSGLFAFADPAWEPSRDPSANVRLAAMDATLRAYAERAPVVAIGGLVQGPCPRAARHLYLAELARAFPDTRLWALGPFVGDVNSCSRHDFDPASVTHRRFAR